MMQIHTSGREWVPVKQCQGSKHPALGFLFFCFFFVFDNSVMYLFPLYMKFRNLTLSRHTLKIFWASNLPPFECSPNFCQGTTSHRLPQKKNEGYIDFPLTPGRLPTIDIERLRSLPTIVQRHDEFEIILPRALVDIDD